jgi:hypothetical protein
MAITPAGTAHCGHPSDKAALELLGVENGEDIAAVTMIGGAILKRPEATQKAELLNPEERNLGEALGTGQHAKQAQKQDLIERVSHLSTLTRVRQIFEMGQKNNRFVEGRAVRSRVAHHHSPPSESSESRIGIDSVL